MNTKYKLDKIINNRYAIWYKDILNDKNKIGVWKIIDLYSESIFKKFAFRLKVKGKNKSQEELDNQILNNTIKNFYKSNNIFYEKNNKRRNN